jgi:hypothetical protein
MRPLKYRRTSDCGCFSHWPLGTIAMPHHPHVITPHSECSMTQHIAPSNCRHDNQLCATPPQYLGAVVICCLFNTLLYPGEVRILVRVGAVDNCGTSADIIGKVGHVEAVMTNH